jgi:hypothetical protein
MRRAFLYRQAVFLSRSLKYPHISPGKSRKGSLAYSPVRPPSGHCHHWAGAPIFPATIDICNRLAARVCSLNSTRLGMPSTALSPNPQTGVGNPARMIAPSSSPSWATVPKASRCLARSSRRSASGLVAKALANASKADSWNFDGYFSLACCIPWH